MTIALKIARSLHELIKGRAHALTLYKEERRRARRPKPTLIVSITWSRYLLQTVVECQRPINRKSLFSLVEKETIRLIIAFDLTGIGAGCRDRTRDPLITNQVLYQLS